MKSLECVVFGNMKSLSGTREAAIEILEYEVGSLETFHIIQHSFLYEGSPEFVVKVDDDQTTLFEVIQKYVANGRKDVDLVCFLMTEMIRVRL